MPGAMPMHVLIQKERSCRWLNVSVLLILIAIIAIDLSTYFKPNTDSAREEARVAETIEGWLREQKEGGDGLRFWASSEVVDPTRFHSVRSWKTIHIEPFDHALVQVDSLTEEGDPISKLWKIYLGMGRDGARLITRIVDAADESVPPPFLAKRQESLVSRKIRREKEEVEAKLKGLSQKINQLEAETERKLGRLDDSLDREKQETGRRMEELVDWLQRMAEQIDRTKRELVAANGQVGPIRDVDPRLVLRGMRIARLPGVRILGPDRLRQLGLQGPVPMPAERDYDYSLKQAEDFYREENYQDAAGIYSDLIERYPKIPAAYLRRGDCYAALRDFDRAIADFGMAIRLMPKDPRAHLARSRAYLGKGATVPALADAAEAIRLDPMLAEAHLVRTEVFDRKGEHDRAGAARSEALTIFYRRGVASIIKHDYEPGIADLEHVIREAPDHAEAHVWCGKAHYLRFDFPNAVKEFTKAIALEPDDKQNYNERGMAFFQTRAYDAAVADFDHAIRLDPKFHEAYLNRGTVRLAEGDFERAAADLSMVIQLDLRNATAYRLRSVAYDKMGSALKAASDLSIAKSLSR
jgi:tetratricopeptide (TPR) repeat protein